MTPDGLQSRRQNLLQQWPAVFAALLLCGCSSIGDLGLVQSPGVADNIHGWVGQAAAGRVGAPISIANLTENERTLRDLAFPLIQPAYDRGHWDQIVYEYGEKRSFRRDLWIADPTTYYRRLLAANYRSTAGRYNRLNDDVRDDVVRITPFFDIAHRVINADVKRQVTLQNLGDVSPQERFDVLARVSENNLIIAWVQESLVHRCESYRFALNRLAVEEPESGVGEVDVSLGLLGKMIAVNQLVPQVQFAEEAFTVAAPVAVGGPVAVGVPVAVAAAPPVLK